MNTNALIIANALSDQDLLSRIDVLAVLHTGVTPVRGRREQSDRGRAGLP
jgi:hypothetical protein